MRRHHVHSSVAKVHPAIVCYPMRPTTRIQFGFSQGAVSQTACSMRAVFLSTFPKARDLPMFGKVLTEQLGSDMTSSASERPEVVRRVAAAPAPASR